MTKVNLADFDTIIFDFGGVIFDINPELTLNAFKRLGGDIGIKSIEDSDILWQFERGEISEETLHKELCRHFNTDINYKDFLEAWIALLLNFKDKRIKRIAELKASHKLIMLSNTNAIHFRTFSTRLFNEYNITFNDLFSKVYLSHEMGLIKPDLRIYKQVIKEQNLTPNKTLFIEDTAANAKAAEELGIKTLTIPRNAEFYEYFE